MTSQLGWVQISRALDAGRANGRGVTWGYDERRARPSDSHRPMLPGHRRRRALHLGWALTMVAVVAIAMMSWAVTAGATPLP